MLTELGRTSCIFLSAFLLFRILSVLTEICNRLHDIRMILIGKGNE